MSKKKKIQPTASNIFQEWSARQVFFDLFDAQEQQQILQRWCAEGVGIDVAQEALSFVSKSRLETICGYTPEELASAIWAYHSHQDFQSLYPLLLHYHFVDRESTLLCQLIEACFPAQLSMLHIEDDKPDTASFRTQSVAALLERLLLRFAKLSSRDLARLMLSTSIISSDKLDHDLTFAHPVVKTLLAHRDLPAAFSLLSMLPQDSSPDEWYRFEHTSHGLPDICTDLDRLLFKSRYHETINIHPVIEELDSLSPNRPQTAFLFGVADASVRNEPTRIMASDSSHFWYWFGTYHTIMQESDQIRFSGLTERYPENVARFFEHTPEAQQRRVFSIYLHALDSECYTHAWTYAQPWMFTVGGPRFLHALINLYVQFRQTNHPQSHALFTLLLHQAEHLPLEQQTQPVRLFRVMASSTHHALPSNPVSEVAPSVTAIDPWILATAIGSATRWSELYAPHYKAAIPSLLRQVQTYQDPSLHPAFLAYQRGLQAMLTDDMTRAQEAFLEAITHANTLPSSEETSRWFSQLHLYAALVGYAGLDGESSAFAKYHLDQIPADHSPSLPEWLCKETANQLAAVDSPGLSGYLDWCQSRQLPWVNEYRRHRPWLTQSAIARQALRAYAENEVRPQTERWKDWLLLLQTAIAAGDGGLMEQAAAVLIDWGQLPLFRKDLLALLSDPRRHDPAIELDEANKIRITLFEQEGQYLEALELLRPYFHRAVNRDHQLHDARGFFERMQSYGLSDELIAPERERLTHAEIAEQDTIPQPSSSDLHQALAKQPVSILFIGGEQAQAQYDEYLLKHFSVYPNLKVSFIHPGWVVKWNSFWDQHKYTIKQADWLVLLTFMRTDLHKKLREESGKPWLSCTGHGRGSIKRTIEDAIWKALQQHRKQA